MKWLTIALSLLFITGCPVGGDSETPAPAAVSDRNDEEQPPVTGEPPNDNGPSETGIIVNAGDNRTVSEAERFSLFADSRALGNDPVQSLRWHQVNDGVPARVLSEIDQNELRLEAPQVQSTREMVFQISAVSAGGQRANDRVRVTVEPAFDNPLPEVDAGPDQDATGGQRVELRGQASDNGTVVATRWILDGDGPGITFEDDSQLDTSFIAPRVNTPTLLPLRLVATDDQDGRGQDRIDIRVMPSGDNRHPVITRSEANPGVATASENVLLIVEAEDPDGDSIQYQWQQIDNGAPQLAIRDSDQTRAMVELPDLSEQTEFRFRIEATDGALSDATSVSLQGVPATEPSPGLIDCLMDPFRSGCPLSVLRQLVQTDTLALCQDDPLSLECPLSPVATVDQEMADCLRNPGQSGCGQVLTQLADPLYFAETLPQPQNTAECTPAFSDTGFEHYTGVMHGHTGFSDGTIGTTPQMAMESVKAAGWDFFAISDHSDNERLPLTADGDCVSERLFDCVIVDSDRPFDVLRKWDATAEQIEAVSDEGFTGIRGFEWTSDRYGHINVFGTDNVLNAKTGPGYALSMGLFWQWFTYPALFGGGDDGLVVFNHPGREDLIEDLLQPAGGDPAYSFNDFRHVPAADFRAVGLEVFGKGSEYDSDGPGGSWLSHALDKGWHVGAISSEDHHGTSWGSGTLPKTVMIARSRSETDLNEALLARRFYAVAQNHNDLLMDFRVDRQPMGARIRVPAGRVLPMQAELTDKGEPREAIFEVVTRNNRLVERHQGSGFTSTLRVSEEEPYYFLRILDPESERPIAFSSPIWVTPGETPLPACPIQASSALQ
ncbi:MAG: hypothetical protein R3296_10855 [Oleiphilaceae bacterium]|nr:hypothetical protein [Oleiphilaceae bacterium]